MWQCSTLADGHTIVELRGFGEVKKGFFTRWWQLKDFLDFLPFFGEMIQFDDNNIFQMGWFNHHLVSHFENNCQVIDAVTLTNPRSLVTLPLEEVTFFTIPKKVRKNCRVLVNLRVTKKRLLLLQDFMLQYNFVAPRNGDEQQNISSRNHRFFHFHDSFWKTLGSLCRHFFTNKRWDSGACDPEVCVPEVCVAQNEFYMCIDDQQNQVYIIYIM